MKKPFGLGAKESPYDHRTVQASATLATPLVSGGVNYLAHDIEHQHDVGICVACSAVQLAQKYWGIQFSADFFYLILQVYYDKDWIEGSAIFHAMKAGKNQGFLREELFCDGNGKPYITEKDRELSYSAYAKKLQAIPQTEIDRLLKLCEHKFSGYAQVDVTDNQVIAKYIKDSNAGIICRFEVGKEWFTPSWLTKDIDPLRPPKKVLSGHAIIASFFDYTGSPILQLANTWGIKWNDENLGKGHVNLNKYRPTEAWIPYFDVVIQPNPPFSHLFYRVMEYGDEHPEVKFLQTALKVNGVYPPQAPITGYYGDITKKAVKAFQYKYDVAPLAELLLVGGKRCGVKTLQKLNDLYNL